MQRPLHARNVNAGRASSPPVEFGSDLTRRRIAELRDNRIQFVGVDRRRRAARLGRGREASELTFQPDPTLHARDTNLEPLAYFSVAAFTGKVRAYDTLTKLNGMRFRHAPNRSETDLRGNGLDQLR